MEDEMQEEKSVLETTIDRRQFTLASAMALLSGVAITITETACGGSSYSPSSPTTTPTPNPTPTPSAGGDKVGTISSNHNHSAVVTAAKITAGAAYSLDIQGSASHPHTVELTVADLTAIAANQRVSKESSTDSAHSHTVTFN
jgi:hypothetical protein